MDIEQRIRESFAKQKMMATFGADVVSVAEGEVVLRAPILELATQQMGFAHAALSFALGDTAAGYAALTTLPEGQEVVTAEIKINLLSPATGEFLEARGRVVKPGRRLVVVSAVVEAVSGATRKEVALMQGSMMPI
jgi:uncharacterized protein (TIGR00369 family)